MKFCDFNHCANAPDLPGIYAWYHTPTIGPKSLSNIILSIQNSSNKPEYIDAMLREYIFNFYSEQPLNVEVRGNFSVRFKGEVVDQNSISKNLIKSIEENPERFRLVVEQLQTSIPHFASPIYIGMAGSLLSRLMSHYNMINSLIENNCFQDFSENLVAEEQANDHSFAKDIYLRKVNPVNLTVFYQVIANSEWGINSVVENILNRINHPICGRN